MRTKGVPIGSPDLNGSPAEETRHKNEAESKNRNTQWMIRLTLKKEKEKRKTRGDLVLTLDVKIDHRPSTPEWNFEIKKEPNREYLTGGSLIWFRSGLGSSHLVVIEMRNQRRRRSAAAPPKVTEQQKKNDLWRKKKKKQNRITSSGVPVTIVWLTGQEDIDFLFLSDRKKKKWMEKISNGNRFVCRRWVVVVVVGGDHRPLVGAAQSRFVLLLLLNHVLFFIIIIRRPCFFFHGNCPDFQC